MVSETEVKYHQPADDSWLPWEAGTCPLGLQTALVAVPVGSRMVTHFIMEQREHEDGVERDGNEY